jgi:hypothetical protein
MIGIAAIVSLADMGIDSTERHCIAAIFACLPAALTQIVCGMCGSGLMVEFFWQKPPLCTGVVTHHP